MKKLKTMLMLGLVFVLGAIALTGCVTTQFTITAPAGEGFTFARVGGTGDKVDKGADFKFKITVKETHEGVPVVKAGATAMTPVNGIYTISNVQSNLTVTVEGLTEKQPILTEYTVTEPTGEGFAYARVEGEGNKVNAGDDFKFTVTVNNTHEGTLVVSVNGAAVAAVSGVYTIEDVQTNKTITVSGLAEKVQWTITAPAGDGFTYARVEGTGNEVADGADFKFTVTVNGTHQGTLVVKVDGTEVTAVDGVYTIEDVKANKTITVSGLTEKTVFTVTPPAGEGFIFMRTGGMSIGNTVNKGEDFMFMITVNTNTHEGTPVVSVDGTPFTAVEGVYTIEDVQSDKTITVTGLTAKILYTVTASVGGYICERVDLNGFDDKIEEGKDYEFKITVRDTHTGTPVVSVGGESIIADSDGVYTIENVQEDKTITVEGLTVKVTPPQPVASIEISNSDEYTELYFIGDSGSEVYLEDVYIIATYEDSTVSEPIQVMKNMIWFPEYTFFDLHGEDCAFTTATVVYGGKYAEFDVCFVDELSVGSSVEGFAMEYALNADVPTEVTVVQFPIDNFDDPILYNGKLFTRTKETSTDFKVYYADDEGGAEVTQFDKKGLFPFKVVISEDSSYETEVLVGATDHYDFVSRDDFDPDVFYFSLFGLAFGLNLDQPDEDIWNDIQTGTFNFMLEEVPYVEFFTLMGLPMDDFQTFKPAAIEYIESEMDVSLGDMFDTSHIAFVALDDDIMMYFYTEDAMQGESNFSEFEVNAIGEGVSVPVGESMLAFTFNDADDTAEVSYMGIFTIHYAKRAA